MKKFFPLIILLAFKLVLDFSYIKFIYPIFGEFPLNISPIKIFESYIFTIFLGVLMTIWFREVKRPSYIIIYVLVLNLLVPMLSFYGLTNGSRAYMYMSIMSIVIVMLLVKKTKMLNIFYIKEGKYIFLIVAASLSFIVLADLLLNGGLSRLNFNVLEVYDVREDFNATSGRIMGYLLPWVAYSVNGVLMALFLYKKKHVSFLLIFVFQLFIFATTGYKSFLYAPFLIIGLHYLLNVKKVKNLFPFMGIGFVLLIVYSLLKFHFQQDLVNGSIFIRRNFFVPAQIHNQYYEFFQTNPFVMLSNSIFSSFIRYPYGDINIVHVVSQYYYHRAFGLNVGYIGNAYLNFGFMGVLTFSVVLGFVLRLLDSVSKNLPLSLSISAIVIPSVAFVNSGLLTTLLTHGFGLSMFLLWMLAKSENNLAPLKIVKIKVK